MPRIKGRRPEATREAALEAARWAFAEYGYANATLAIIAQKAGVTAATLPYHFNDKKGLWDATIADFYKALFAFAAELRPSDDLETVLPRFYDWSLAHRDGIRVIIRNVIETGSLDQAVREVNMTRAIDLVAALASRRYGVSPANARDATVAVTHLMTRFITNSAEDNRQAFQLTSDAEVRDRIIAILVRTSRALLQIPEAPAATSPQPGGEDVRDERG